MSGASDIALISLGTTPGLRRADAVFKDAADTAGVSCEVVHVQIGAAGKLRRQMTVTDLVEARAARAAARGVQARVMVFSTVTAALLQEPGVPYAIRFDSPAFLNRPGTAGAWQRRAERRAMERARVLLPWGEPAKAALPASLQQKAIPMRVPIEKAAPEARGLPPFAGFAQPSERGQAPRAGGGIRDVEALAYAGYPEKRGLDLLIRAWNEVGHGRPLLVAGIDRERAEAWLKPREVPLPATVDFVPLMDRDEWEATLRRTRIFVNASRREDHGLSQLEALAAGALLVTVPSVGPYEALPIARRLEPRFVSTAIDAYPLARALRAVFEADADPAYATAYAQRAAHELEPYSRDAVQRVFETQVLPALGLR